jgi:hypothetical protein
MKNIIVLVALVIFLSGLAMGQLKDEVQFGAGLQTVVGKSSSLIFQFTTYSPEHMGFFIDVSVGMRGRYYSHMIIPVDNWEGAGGLQICLWNKSAILVGYGFGARYNEKHNRRPYERHRGWLIGVRVVSPNLFQNRRDNIALTLALSPASVETLVKNKWEKSHKNIVTLGVTWNI